MRHKTKVVVPKGRILKFGTVLLDLGFYEIVTVYEVQNRSHVSIFGKRDMLGFHVADTKSSTVGIVKDLKIPFVNEILQVVPLFNGGFLCVSDKEIKVFQ